MLLDLIKNLRTALLIIVFIGFIFLGVLTIFAEHKYYVLHFEGKFKYAKLIYWMVAIMTAAALMVMYRLFFLEIYPSPAVPSPTAYV
ncbi:hypothetical protein JXA63_03050 [Candidatus Woesebacteria bacterium]|nr:hypothetical protein [Candidatus Woesebacteria bacterium]